MLQAQMPVAMADNSFNLNEPGRVKSEKSGSLNDQNKFIKIYESASSEKKKVKSNSSGEKDVEEIASKADFKKSVKQLKLKRFQSEDLVRLKNFPKTKNGKLEVADSRERRFSFMTKATKVKKKEAGESQNNLLNKPEDSDSNEIPSVLEVNPVLSVQNNAAASEAGAEVLTPGEGSVSGSDSVFSQASVETGEIIELRPEDRLEGKAQEKDAVKKKSGGKTSKLRIVDLRESGQRSERAVRNQASIKSSEEKVVFNGTERDQVEKGENAKPIVVEMVHIRDNFSGESKTLTTTTASSLMKQLEETVNNNIVKQSSVILKDNDTGEIKLILKPESLGRVRIRLNLAENRISGQIIVENAAIKEVFEQNLQNLERAFKENGYDTASLNVSVGGDGSGSGDRERNSDIAKQIEIIDEIIPTVLEEQDNLIDLVV